MNASHFGCCSEQFVIFHRVILIQNQIDTNMVGSQAAMAEMEKVAQLIKYATIIISSLPLVVMYPFFQKYFDKGVMVGSLKG